MDLNMFTWVTKGKEIENYIPSEAVQEMFEGKKIKQCDQYELFPDYIEKYYKGFTGKKVIFANQIVPMITKDNSGKMMDLEKRISNLYDHIGKWNGLN